MAGKFLKWVVVASLAGIASWPIDAAGPAATGGAADGANAAVDGVPLPLVRTHVYRMAGRVRPLLFWIGRDDVGLARLAWREGGEGQSGYDFLVGTDPSKAPRRINRWGFISERRSDLDGAVLAVMSKSDEASLDEAQSNAAAHGGNDFKAMRAVSRGGRLSWQVARVQSPDALTIHEIVPLLERVRTETTSVSARSRTVDADARPGFLVAVAELVDRAVAAAGGRKTCEGVTNERVPYVFGQQSYEVRVAEAKKATSPRPGDVGPLAACDAVFDILNTGSKEHTQFDMRFATSGKLTGVPTFIAWQPRWWLKVELALVE